MKHDFSIANSLLKGADNLHGIKQEINNNIGLKITWLAKWERESRKTFCSSKGRNVHLLHSYEDGAGKVWGKYLILSPSVKVSIFTSKEKKNNTQIIGVYPLTVKGEVYVSQTLVH